MDEENKESTDAVKQLARVAKDIEKVEKAIEKVESQLEEEADKEEKRYLRDEKKQLRDKEKQLRDEKNLLLKRQASQPDPATPVKKQLKRIEDKVEGLVSRMAGMSPFKPETTVSRRLQFRDVYRDCRPTTSVDPLPASILQALSAVATNSGFFGSGQRSVCRGDKETVLQTYGNKQLQRACQTGPLDHHDTSAVHVLPSGSQPDNVFTPTEFFFGPSTCVFDLEWKKFPEKPTLKFDEDEKGQAINYGLEFMDAQPWREFMFVAICNLDVLQFFKIERGDRVTEYAAVAFLGKDGPRLLAGFLSLPLEDLGFSLPKPSPPMEMKGWEPFEGGATSVVYRSTDTHQIMKVHREKDHTERELAIYRQLDGSVPNIPILQDQGENYIILTDNGRQICTSDPSFLFVDVLDALEVAHQKGLVHRDVRPANITIRDGKAALVDWGFATHKDKVANFSGTMSFASDHVLADPQKYRPNDDLHSLVRSLVYLKELHASKLCRSPKLEKLRAFWQGLKVPFFYKQLANLAEALDYKSLRDQLKAHPLAGVHVS